LNHLKGLLRIERNARARGEIAKLAGWGKKNNKNIDGNRDENGGGVAIASAEDQIAALVQYNKAAFACPDLSSVPLTTEEKLQQVGIVNAFDVI
jgi:hypothetical protein